jgi:hypothetical protein
MKKRILFVLIKNSELYPFLNAKYNPLFSQIEPIFAYENEDLSKLKTDYDAIVLETGVYS